MTKKEWNINKTAELKYKQSLKKIQREMLKYIPSFDNAEIIRGSLELLAGEKSFNELAISVATKFVLDVNMEDVRTWREAAKLMSGGSLIYDLLKQSLNQNVESEMMRIVTENARYITKMPLDVAEKMTYYASKSTFEGLTYKQIANDMKKRFEGYTESRINLIARTESSKASTSLSEARSKDVGVNWYIWRTALDGDRVRDSHQIMEGVVCNWGDPPSPEVLDKQPSQGKYHPGGIYNCRCFPQPLILTNQIQWPAKVHLNGRIVYMSLEEFKKIGG